MLKKPLFLFAFLLLVTFGLSLLQGYWRHDAWTYTQSELHEVADGRWLAPLLHLALHRLPPELSVVACLIFLGFFLWSEIKRIYGKGKAPLLLIYISILTIFSPSVLSQLQWPTHSLAACLPLLLSLIWQNKKHVAFRVLRTFIISLGSLSILSSFVFIAPICLVQGDNNVHYTNSKHKTVHGAILRGLIAPSAIIILAIFLVSLAKRIYTSFDSNVLVVPSRLESISKVNFISDIHLLFTTLETYIQRQWGHLWVAIPVIIAIVLIIGLRNALSKNLEITFIMLWILFAPIFAAIGSGTTWQRVAFGWFLIPPLLGILVYDVKTSWLRECLIFALLASCLVSIYISFHNYGISAIATRRILNQVKSQLPNSYKKGSELVVLEVDNIDYLSPKYIWGGWPPFAKANPRNIRIHRIFNELGIEDYIVKQGALYFPLNYGVDFQRNLTHLSQHERNQIILKRYNRLKGIHLARTRVIRLTSRKFGDQ